MNNLIDGISKDQLMNCYRLAAQVASIYGDAYLPVFQRLHDEVEKTKRNADIKSIAMLIATCNNDVEVSKQF
jgi:hypothetical protein